MSYITPNTTITLYKNVPLDNTYEHTIYFANVNQQNTYFSGLANQVSFANNTYQRSGVGKIRLALNGTSFTFEKMYQYNYMRFKNTSFENKWMYAFITDVEYINDVTVELSFEIDVLQTWHFDYTKGKSFIERAHQELSDDAGDNLIPEDFELGEYVYGAGGLSTADVGSMYIVMAVSRLLHTGTARQDGGQFLNGSFTGLKFIIAENKPGGAIVPSPQSAEDYDGAQKIIHYIKEYATYDDTGQSSIVSIFLAPKKLFEQTLQNEVWSTTQTMGKPSTLDTYTPHNKKLLTYPYTALYVTNFNGSAAEYPYEYFSTPGSPNNCIFTVTGDTTVGCTLMAYPSWYKGIQYNKEEKLEVSGFPQLPWVQDVFAQWISKKGIALGIAALAVTGSVFAGGVVAASSAAPTLNAVSAASTLNAGINAVGSAATSTIAKATSSANLAKTGALAGMALGSVYKHSMTPPQAKGSSETVINALEGTYNFGFGQKCIRPDFAERIDNYMSMYGYKQNSIQDIHPARRNKWTFIRTIGANIFAGNNGVPEKDIEQIKAIYNNGITFWRYNNGVDVGNYDFANNQVLAQPY